MPMKVAKIFSVTRVRYFTSPTKIPVQAKKGQKGKECSSANIKSFSNRSVIGPVGRKTNKG